MKLGKLPETCLKRSVLRQVGTKREEVESGAGVGADCAIFSFPGEERTAVCVQEALLSAEGGFCGPEPVYTPEQLIQKCVNNLAAERARPAAVMIALLLPESFEEERLKSLMARASEKCRELDLQIAGGQTRVSGAAAMPVAAVTALGSLPRGMRGSVTAKPGQDVVVSKWVGLQGTALLARRHREQLLSRYPAYLVDEAAGFDRYLSVIPEAATAIKSGVRAMHDISEGGIFGALWELAERAGVGLTIDLKKLPLRQETVEVCEHCGANPYTLLSGGSLLMTADDGQELAAALETAGIPAAVVGKVTEGRERILRNADEVRYLERPQPDSVYEV